MEQLGFIRHPGPADSGEGITCKGSQKNILQIFLDLSPVSGEVTEALAACAAWGSWVHK